MASTLTQRVDALMAAVEALTTLVAASSTTAPTVATVAAIPAEVAPVHVGPSGKPDGRRFTCTLGCGRLLRSAKRASIHGVELGGHTPA